ncbi:hypothetical protein [Shinella sp. BYT-45]|uniref:hypothetical protein n=1 Tax=Shinella sp. BYT-45 TaxID=3377377 RepID=UPI003980910C
MYFNVYTDSGSVIEGYLIPDGFSAKPEIVVRCEGSTFGPLPCDVFLSGPYDHKHHETGIVGFRLDEEKIPGLAGAKDIEIADAESGFIIYRRLLPAVHIRKRIFRLETQFAPHQEFDRSLKPYFQFYAAGAEKYGSETVRQMLEIVNQPSTYVSGRVMLKSVQQYFTQDTIRITSIRDPFYELAIRLGSISVFKRRRLSFVSERDEILFEPAMAYFADTNLTDYDAVRQKIRSAPKDILALFESPFTHQLVAASPTDKVSRDGVSAALDALSQFTVFSANEKDAQLAIDVAELLGVDETAISFSPVRSPFLELADVLREIKILEHVLENDLILFYFIRKAESRALRGAI